MIEHLLCYFPKHMLAKENFLVETSAFNNISRRCQAALDEPVTDVKGHRNMILRLNSGQLCLDSMIASHC